MRLIDADALKEYIGGVRATYNCFDEDERKFYETYSKAIEILDIYLEDAPAINAVDVQSLAEIASKHNVKIDFEIKEDGGCEVWIEPMHTE